MDLRRLRWITVVVPLVFLLVIDAVRHLLWPQVLHPWPGYLAVVLVVTLGVWAFSQMVFDHIERVEGQLLARQQELARLHATAARQAAQLRALHEAGLAVVSTLDLEALLQKITDTARDLVGARYGALALFDERGQVVRFLVSGLSPEERQRLGDPPKGRGLLGAVLQEGRPIRVDDIARDPRSVGFPPGHPPMTTFLGVPILVQGRPIGNLYLTDKMSQGQVQPFAEADEEVLRLFAALAAVAIENARLHAEVQVLATLQERERIARELHDSLAQVLGFIRLQVAAAREAAAQGETTALRELLAQIETAAGEAYADVREAILGLRSRVGTERDLLNTLRQYLDRYQRQTGLTVHLEASPTVATARLSPAAEVQLLRIIQEALTNVRKHARARQVWLRLATLTGDAQGALQCQVVDDGRGFDPCLLAGDLHFGLATMHERAESVGGRLRIESAPGQGTCVTVTLPLANGQPGLQEQKR